MAGTSRAYNGQTGFKYHIAVRKFNETVTCQRGSKRGSQMAQIQRRRLKAENLGGGREVSDRGRMGTPRDHKREGNKVSHARYENKQKRPAEGGIACRACGFKRGEVKTQYHQILTGGEAHIGR